MAGFMKSALNLFGLSKKDGATGSDSTGGDLDAFLSELPQVMGFDVSIRRKDGAEGFDYEVEGPEADSFLGDSAEILDALSHISMRVLRRAEGKSNVPAGEGAEQFRVTFDSGGFRDKRIQELKELAESQRQRVIDSGGKPSYIAALSPSERKVIHTHLSDLGEVMSESIGKGTFKRIRVRLKDDSQFRRAQPAGEEGENTDQQPRSFQSQGPRGPGGPRGQGGGSRGGRGRRGGGGGPRGPGGPGGRGGRRDQGNQPGFGSNHPVDDNVGNRLRPGEEPNFVSHASVANDDGDYSSSDDNFGNR
jgi:predicted RNA-binding protein Jag